MSTAQDYRLLDSGNLRRLEQVGSYRIIRPALNAFWSCSLPESEWQKADAEFIRGTQSGNGAWHAVRPGAKPLPAVFTASHHGVTLQLKPTAFGHLGLFPEHADNVWPVLSRFIKHGGKNLTALNLFAYTGCLSLLCAKNGVKVTHCDASQPTVEWAKRNLALNADIEPSIRWIVDDAFKFVGRERRRGGRYNMIILDPPSYGRGTQNQVWKIEDKLPELLQSCRDLLVEEGPSMVCLTAHTQGFNALTLMRLMHDCFARYDYRHITGVPMRINQSNGEFLPAGDLACFSTFDQELLFHD